VGAGVNVKRQKKEERGRDGVRALSLCPFVLLASLSLSLSLVSLAGRACVVWVVAHTCRRCPSRVCGHLVPFFHFSSPLGSSSPPPRLPLGQPRLHRQGQQRHGHDAQDHRRKVVPHKGQVAVRAERGRGGEGVVSVSKGALAHHPPSPPHFFSSHFSFLISLPFAAAHPNSAPATVRLTPHSTAPPALYAEKDPYGMAATPATKGAKVRTMGTKRARTTARPPWRP
jgi:hypothetical protein